MGAIFDPDELHEIAKLGVGKKDKHEMFRVVGEALKERHPQHIRLDQPWIFNNAGGAMGMMKLLHASISEYVIFFGSPIGTEGHSGRYRTEVYDFMLDGEMWTYHAGDFDRSVFRPGDKAFLGSSLAKGYNIPERGWMLEYARGPIPSMVPFGLADTVFSTLDINCTVNTLKQYGGMVVRELMQGKI